MEEQTMSHVIHDSLRGLMRKFADRWRYASAQREFACLDATTVRDLGMSRSEFDSYWAESQGLAEQTRERVNP
jgi:hypothetical protein